MEPLLILLVIPAIAFMMLRADSIRVNGLDPETRDYYRKLLPLIAIIVSLLGVLFLFLGLRNIQDFEISYENFALMMARLSLGAGLLYLAWKALQLSKHTEEEDLPLQVIVRRDIEATSARTVAILFILLPLVLPSLVLLSTIGFIPILVYGFSAFPKRYVQNQLLWTLSLAAKNDMDMASEVYSLANSMNAERQSGRTLAMKIAGSLSIVFLVPMFYRARARKRMIEQLFQLSSALYDGVPLATALSLQPNLLPPEIIGAVEAATATGDVGTVLSKIALEHSRQLENRTTIGRTSENSAAYTAMIVLMTCNVVAFIMYWIIPKFKAIFQDFGVELPQITQTWISISDFMMSYWYLAGPIMFLPMVPFLLGAMMMLDDSTWLPSYLLRMFPRIEAPMLLRRLGYVAGSNMHLQPSLLSLASATPDFARSRRFERLENRLQLGDSLGNSLQDEGFVNAREAHSIDYSSKM
ncbi:type II secretion system F family protein, partial [bacterium]|nr:type II secretion system F family protein [bacterium]